MEGFFKSSVVVSSNNRKSSLPKCGACGLYKSCESPKMDFSGKGKKGILIVGEFPGKWDDERGKHFVSRQSEILREFLMKYGIDMREDCWLTNAIICYPTKGKFENKQIEYCQPNLLKTIKQLQPVCIIPLGFAAVKSVIGAIWKSDVGPIQRWLGWTIPYQKWNVWICPNLSLNYIVIQENQRKPDPVPRLLFEKYLAKALKLSVKSPWGTIPNYQKQVQVILDPKEAARFIYKMIKRVDTIAFDYETNMLKPEHPQSRIVSCSICHAGNKTISYPWHGEAITATRKIIRSEHPKVASNLKFEERWTLHHLNTRVRNWFWDTMISAHVMNNVPGICSIKFQAFVLLGIDSYNDHIDKFLKSDDKGGYAINRIHEIDLKQLLMYGGLDSLLEFLVFKKQESIYV